MLHTIREWEEKANGSVKFISVFFNDNRQVTKVMGKFQNKVTGWTFVHWDGFGRCYVGAGEKRIKGGDIKFE